MIVFSHANNSSLRKKKDQVSQNARSIN